MKSTTVLGLLAGVLLGSTSALAADLGGAPARQPRYYEQVEQRDIGPWSGFYLGVAAGYGWGQGGADGDVGKFNFDQSGALGTIFAGYNWQFGRAVAGIEADIGTGNLKSSTVTTFGNVDTELNSMGSVRGRLGFLATPALLLYGTGGFAWANYELGINGFQSTSKTFTGYQVGLGSEYMLSNNMTLRAEYIYTDLGREELSSGGLTNGFNPDFHTVRAGIAVKF